MNNFLTKLKKLRGKLIKKTKNENDAKFSFNNYKFLNLRVTFSKNEPILKIGKYISFIWKIFLYFFNFFGFPIIKLVYWLNMRSIGSILGTLPKARNRVILWNLFVYFSFLVYHRQIPYSIENLSLFHLIYKCLGVRL